MPQPTEENVTWLSQEAYDKLVAELEYLKGPARSEISQRIGDARDEGDLKENGGYHAAKEEQGMAEARIRILENMLRRAKVGQTPGDNGVVGLGMTVTVRFEGDDDTETFLLGSRELVGLDQTVGVNVYSPQSPLGAAVTGKHTGDEATFKAPNGARMTVQIVDAKPYSA